MTLAEGISIATAIFAVGSALGGGFYARGKLDTHATNANAKIDDLASRISKLDGLSISDAEDRGAQVVRNSKVDELVSQTREAERLAIRLEARLDAHEAQCKDRQVGLGQRFDKIDRDIERLSALINNINRGDANRLRQIGGDERSA